MSIITLKPHNFYSFKDKDTDELHIFLCYKVTKKQANFIEVKCDTLSERISMRYFYPRVYLTQTREMVFNTHTRKTKKLNTEDDEDVDYEECSVSLSPFRKDLKVNLSTLNNVWGLNSLTHNLLHKEVDFDEYRDFIKSFDKLYCISEERYEPLRKLFKNVSYPVIHTEDEYWEDVMANRDL